MTSNTLFPRLAIAILAMALLGACQARMGGVAWLPTAIPGTGSPYSGSPNTGSPYTGAAESASPYAKSSFMAIPYEKMPEDARKISMAVERHIAARPAVPVDGVAFSTLAAQSNMLPWLQSEGFALTESSLYRHHRAAAAGLSQSAGRLDYTDALGRRVGFLWFAEHRATGESRMIERLEVAPAFEARPRVHLALIPTAALPGGSFPTVGSYADLAKFVAQYALRPNQVPSGKAEYFIVLSSLDPISSSAKLDLRISSSGTGIEGSDQGAGHALISNWGLTVLRGTLDLGGRAPLYAKAVFTPGREAGRLGQTARVVGVFNLKPGQQGS